VEETPRGGIQRKEKKPTGGSQIAAIIAPRQTSQPSAQFMSPAYMGSGNEVSERFSSQGARPDKDQGQSRTGQFGRFGRGWSTRDEKNPWTLQKLLDVARPVKRQRCQGHRASTLEPIDLSPWQMHFCLRLETFPRCCQATSITTGQPGPGSSGGMKAAQNHQYRRTCHNARHILRGLGNSAGEDQLRARSTPSVHTEVRNRTGNLAPSQ